MLTPLNAHGSTSATPGAEGAATLLFASVPAVVEENALVQVAFFALMA
jgi:hypothetical protein